VETHEGVVAFRTDAPGRERILLGRIPIGEIGPVHDDRAPGITSWLRIDLPFVSSRRHLPARDVADARRQALEKINDWMIAAGVRPVGGAA
jgi:hypothetical protein